MGVFDSFPKVFPHLFGFPWEAPARTVTPGVVRPPAPGVVQTGISAAAMQTYRNQIAQANNQNALASVLPGIQSQYNSKAMTAAQYSELITLYNARMTAVLPKQSLTVTSPTEGQVFTSGQGVTLSANMSGTSQANLPIQWYVNSTPLPGSYVQFNSAGQVPIFAEVQDPAYGRVASSLRTVTVKAAQAGPVPTKSKFYVDDTVYYYGVPYYVTHVWPVGYYSDTTFGYQIQLLDSSYQEFGYQLQATVAETDKNLHG